MQLDFADDKSIFVQVMAWCHQATNHYLSHGWRRSMSPNVVVTRPQRVKESTSSGNMPWPEPILFLIYIYIYMLLISMLWHMKAIFEPKGDKLSSSAESRIRTQRVSETQSPADWMHADKPTELSRIKLKTWTRQPVPMISKHSAHLAPLPFGIRTWLWRYTYLLLLISMLWHRHAKFEYKGDQLSSSAECRIRTQRVSET